MRKTGGKVHVASWSLLKGRAHTATFPRGD